MLWVLIRSASTKHDQPAHPSLQGTMWVASDPERLQADRKDSDQTAHLIHVFAGSTCSLIGNPMVQLIRALPTLPKSTLSRRQRQQAMLGCTPIVNSMKLTTVSCPCLSRSVPKLPISRFENWREIVIFLKYILFFSFCESLKMLLNSKKYTRITFNKNAKMKRKNNTYFDWFTWRFNLNSSEAYQIL